MVITVLDAKVEEKNWLALKDAYAKETADIDQAGGIRQTFLIQSQSQPSSWRIITHWRSQKDLDDMRQNVEVPTGVRIFRAAGAEPTLSVWDLETHRQNKASG